MARQWLVAAVLLLALGGCGDEPEAEPATVPVPATSSEAPVSPRPSSAVEGFVAVVQRKLPGVAVDHRDEEIVALARQACAALAAGRPADTVVAEVRTFGADRAAARQLVRLAIETMCPGQERRIDEF